MTVGRPAMRPEEVLRVLRLVRELSAEKRLILVGGQAVAWWVNYFEQALGTSVAAPGPTTSKDIDFEGAADAAREVAALLDGVVHVPQPDHHTPNTGVVSYVDPEGEEHVIDFLTAPLGLDEMDVERTAQRFDIPDRDRDEPAVLWVLHPERCMESRIANVMTLKTRHQLALDQLRASITCTRLFMRLLLDDGHVRDVLKLNERIFRRCLQVRTWRELDRDLGIDPFDAVLVDDRLGRFASVRHPQMVRTLAARRKR